MNNQAPPDSAPNAVCLRQQVEKALTDYFEHMNGEMPSGLHQLLLGQVERPLLMKTLDYAGGNQTRAAQILGISRATLRKKLALYEL